MGDRKKSSSKKRNNAKGRYKAKGPAAAANDLQLLSGAFQEEISLKIKRGLEHERILSACTVYVQGLVASRD